MWRWYALCPLVFRDFPPHSAKLNDLQVKRLSQLSVHDFHSTTQPVIAWLISRALTPAPVSVTQSRHLLCKQDITRWDRSHWSETYSWTDLSAFYYGIVYEALNYRPALQPNSYFGHIKNMETTTALKRRPRMVLPPGEHNGVSVYVQSPDGEES